MNTVWTMVRKIQQKGGGPGIQHLRDGDRLLTMPDEIAKKLADAFEHNSSSNNCQPGFLPVKNREEQKRLNFKSQNREDYNRVFTLEELRLSLRKSHNTAVGPDKIHYEFLKNLPEGVQELLLEQFNKIWASGEFPSSWKEATIIPIPKAGKDHSESNNYRPIALTSCLCKTMERMINDRLVWILELEGHISTFQCGFRRGRSTLDHLVRLESHVRDAFIHKEHAIAIFFDLEKAYDTTWKHGIMRDLFDMGFRGRLPLFISAFLSNRRFRMRLGLTLSNLHRQELGVPQGSILSVMLFSIKINSIMNMIQKDVACCLYVDDLLIYS